MTVASTVAHKVAEAKRLLIAATRQQRREYQAASAAQRCQCGHRRDEHTISTSINYTEGFCMTDGCKCRWFLLAEESNR